MRPGYFVITAETTAMDGTRRKLRAAYKETGDERERARQHIRNRCKEYIWLGVEINVHTTHGAFSFVFEG